MTKLGQKRKSPKKPMKRKQIKLFPLDILFSKLVRAKANNTCEYCGHTSAKGGMHCSHFIGRRYRNTRWVEENCSCLCFACHNLMHDFPAIHKSFFVKRIGSDGVERLENLARSGAKVDIEAVALRLKKQLQDIKGVDVDG